MTKENFTSINVIIDKSGSMSHLATDTIGGFNSFLKDQKAVPGEAVVTLCTFSTGTPDMVYNFVKITDTIGLTEKTYHPSGGTALLDAIGATMNLVGTKLASLSEEERPSKVIFLIITDGHENSSHEFSKDQIKSMVEHQKSVYNWEFVFMGANIDAIDEGTNLGVSTFNSLNYDASSAGTHELYQQVSNSMTSYRGGHSQQVDFFNQPTNPNTPTQK